MKRTISLETTLTETFEYQGAMLIFITNSIYAIYLIFRVEVNNCLIKFNKTKLFGLEAQHDQIHPLYLCSLLNLKTLLATTFIPPITT